MLQSSLWQEPETINSKGAPGLDAALIEGWLGQEDTCCLFNILFEELDWHQSIVHIAGKSHPIPRLNAWYGDSDCHYSYSGAQLNLLPWHPSLKALRDRINTELGLNLNSCLANLYRDGSDRVGWHSDDERELGSKPVIVAVSLGACRRFSFKHRQLDIKPLHLDLQPGSLLIMKGETQRCWHHQVPKQAQVTAARISLTFREVVAGTISAGQD